MQFERVRQSVGECRAFEDLTRKETGLLLALASPRTLTEGELLFKKGDKCTDTFVLLVDGVLNILDGSGGVLFVKSPGELVGEMGRLNPQHERTKSVAAGNYAEILVWSFPEVEAEDAAIMGKLMEGFEEIAFERLAQDLG